MIPLRLSLFFLVFFAIALHGVRCQYQPNWASLNSRPLPQWYDDAKFGIFIHWGVYSVPSWAPVGTYAEWYWNDLEMADGPTYDFHVATYGADFPYAEFAPKFTAELYDPDFWADLFVNSGAKYIVLTSKHHEGYTNWPSAQSWNWNSVAVGPKRDILGELFNSVRARGIHAGAYYSLYEWFNPVYRGPNPHDYVDQIMLPQLYDLVKTYAPDVIWSDGEWEQLSSFWNSTEFLAWLYNEAPNKDVVVVDDRWGAEVGSQCGDFYTAEYSSEYWLDHKWEANCGMDVHSYGLNRASSSQNYSTTEQLINLLVRTVAFGGNLLLDIGPSWDGTIPLLMQQRLLEMGDWLSTNGEAIYGSRIWNVAQSENFTVGSETIVTFYTTNKTLGNLYAIFTSWPLDFILNLSVPQINPSATQVTMLGDPQQRNLTYQVVGDVLQIELPIFAPGAAPSDYAWALRITNVVNF